MVELPSIISTDMETTSMNDDAKVLEKVVGIDNKRIINQLDRLVWNNVEDVNPSVA